MTHPMLINIAKGMADTPSKSGAAFGTFLTTGEIENMALACLRGLSLTLTDDVVEAGRGPYREHNIGDDPYANEIEDIWQAMIGRILGEEAQASEKVGDPNLNAGEPKFNLALAERAAIVAWLKDRRSAHLKAANEAELDGDIPTAIVFDDRAMEIAQMITAIESGAHTHKDS